MWVTYKDKLFACKFIGFKVSALIFLSLSKAGC